MSDSTPMDLSRLIPGFNFFQGLAGGGRASGGATDASGFNHWIAPTVNVEELDRRINEMKAVQFWLEQNLLGLKATVQALEVQKMTLATLRSMNLSLSDVAKAFTLPGAKGAAGKTPASWPFVDRTGKATPAGAAAPAQKPVAGAKDTPPDDKGPGAAAVNPAVLDPAKWWGALTQQFQQIAAQTLKEVAQQVPAPGVEPKPAATPKTKGAVKARTAARAGRKPAARAKAVKKAVPSRAKK